MKLERFPSLTLAANWFAAVHDDITSGRVTSMRQLMMRSRFFWSAGPSAGASSALTIDDRAESFFSHVVVDIVKCVCVGVSRSTWKTDVTCGHYSAEILWLIFTGVFCNRKLLCTNLLLWATGSRTETILWNINENVVCVLFTELCAAAYTEGRAAVKWSQSTSFSVLTAPLDGQLGSFSRWPRPVTTPISPWFLHTQRHRRLSPSSSEFTYVPGQ